MEVHWYPTKLYILGTSESSAVPENSFFSPYSPEAIWRVSEKDCFTVSLQGDLIWLRRRCLVHTRCWVKSDPETILKRPVVDSKGIYPAYREAPARRHSPSSSGYHFDNNVPNRSAEQTRLAVYNWNRGPRRRKAGAIESHIAGKWHIITLQKAIEYLQHDFFLRTASM